MKVNSRNYKGIEYVEINDLPREQQQRLAETLNEEFLIKILIDKKIVGNCIQYKDYVLWFENTYKAVAQPVKVDRPMVEAAPINIAFGKA